ncbi:hypothetical protein AB6D11_02885 [Vibrio splendidus]
MSDNNPVDVIFTPKFQDTYWSALTPDLRGYLDEVEKSENWTFEYDSFPEFFNKISRVIPKFSELEVNPDNQSVIKNLIKVLAAMKFRESISALAWLDFQMPTERSIGWGAMLFIECSDIYNRQPNHPLYSEAKIVYERVKVILRTQIATQIFYNIGSSEES